MTCSNRLVRTSIRLSVALNASRSATPNARAARYLAIAHLPTSACVTDKDGNGTIDLSEMTEALSKAQEGQSVTYALVSGWDISVGATRTCHADGARRARTD